MQVGDVSNLRAYSEHLAEGVTLTLLSGADGGSLLAVELLEVEAGGTVPQRSAAEEQVLFVISGTGEMLPGDGAPIAVRGGSVVSVSPLESYSLRNADNTRLRVLVSTSLVARTPRALGVRGQPSPTVSPAAPPPAQAPAPPPVEEPAPRPARATTTNRLAEPAQSPAPASTPPAAEAAPENGDAAAVPDISSLMKRGSDVAGKPRSEQRKPPPQPEVEAEPAVEDADDGDEEETPERQDLLELQVVFDGGSRGNPGEGYGSFLVQQPGRRPAIKQVEFGDNYTNNQAEYDTLIRAVQYITERLTSTGRSPEQVQLDIKTDSDLVVNQLLGTFKVKDASLRKRHEQAVELLGTFADWTITWHARDESVRLLGH